MPRYTLDDYLSRDEAHTYLVDELGHVEDYVYGKERTQKFTKRQWLHRIQSGAVAAIPLGERRVPGTDKTAPMTICFTKRMLKEYHDDNMPVAPTEAEINGIMTFHQVAEEVGAKYDTIKKRFVVYEGGIPYKIIGKVSIVLRRDFERWRETAVFRPRS